MSAINRSSPQVLVSNPGGGGGGGTLIFAYIRRLGSFLGFKILNFNIFWGFSKK